MQLSAGSCPLKLLPSAFTQPSFWHKQNPYNQTSSPSTPHCAFHSGKSRFHADLQLCRQASTLLGCFLLEESGGQLSPNRTFLPIAGEQVEAGCSLCPTTFTKRKRGITHTKICSKATQHPAKSLAFSMLDLLPSHLPVSPWERGALPTRPPSASPGLALCFEACNSQIQKNRIHSAPGWQCWT